MSRWTIVVWQASPSANKFAYSHWRTRHQSKNEWLLLIRAAHGFVDVQQASGRRRMILTRYGHNHLDEDNLAGGAKGIIDSLRHWGLLIDDSPEHAELIFRNGDLRTKDALEHTTIELEDLTAEERKPMEAFEVVFRCKGTPQHIQKIKLDDSLGMTLKGAKEYAGLIDGSSTLYVFPPREGDAGKVGKCAACGALIHPAEITDLRARS